MELTLLGTAAAWPIPRPGCRCSQCAEARGDAALRRTRTGLRIDTGTEIVLVDAGPDLAFQLERDGRPPRVDRLLVTHAHADHVLGLDDLVNLRCPSEALLRVHAAPHHRERLASMFPQLVRKGRERIRWGVWEDGTRLEFGGGALEGFETGHRDAFPTTAVLLHGRGAVPAPRIAFATDMGRLPASSRERLRGLDLLIGDGTFLGEAGHGHPGTDAVLTLARDLGIRRVAFTHIGHVELEDAALRRRLGEDVRVLRDGDALVL